MGERFGQYEILRKIATGGMAEILLAKQSSFGGFERLVCLKRILPTLSEQEDFIKMFQDEARIVASLTHPNIAQIYEVGKIDHTYFIAMEYVRGEDLRRIYNQEVARMRTLPPEMAAHIAIGVASGLDYAHRQTNLAGHPLGIVHRDISPQNILLTYDGHVKIVDFGVAKATGKMTETRSGVLKGKYSYMSPEQAAGDPIDGRTDIFALGITLYEVTTGTRLFKRTNELETLHAVIACQITPPHELVPGYPVGLEKIILKALAKDAEARYQTAGELASSLQQYLLESNHSLSSSVTLANYMQELFADKLADEVLFGGLSSIENDATINHDDSVDDSLAKEQRFAESAAAKGGKKKKNKAELSATYRDQKKIKAPYQSEMSDPALSLLGVNAAKTQIFPTEDLPGKRAKERTQKPLEISEWDKTSTLFKEPMEAYLHQWPVPSKLTSVAANPDEALPIKIQSGVGGEVGESTKSRWIVFVLFLLLAGSAAVGWRLWQQKIAVKQFLQAPLQSLRSTKSLVPLFIAKEVEEDLESFSEPNPEPEQKPEVVSAAPKSPKNADFLDPFNASQTTHGLLSLREPPLTDVFIKPVNSEKYRENYLGQTPLKVILPPDTYQLWLRQKNLGFIVRQQITIKAQEEQLLILERGILDIQAKPWAWIKIGELVPKETPLRLELFVGDYEAIFECPQGQRGTLLFTITPKNTLSRSINCGSKGRGPKR